MHKPAAKVGLVTRVPLKAADFASQSLLDFTKTFCGASHARMKAALHAWMLAHGFDAIVKVNSDPSEVVVAQPKDALAIETVVCV